MPYVLQAFRDGLDRPVDALADSIEHESNGTEIPERTRPGLVNYAVTRLLHTLYPTPSYADYNEMIGVIECIKQELYRRVVAPYEDIKLEQNGDVFARSQEQR